MNKKNKILVGCLALLLALSVGYALFSDTITINGTATAKGSFDITATCEPGIASKLGTVESLGFAAEGGYENDTCLVDDDTVSMKADFLYPGAKRYYTIKFTNTGSIDAILNAAEITDRDEICVADNKEGNNKECKSQENTKASLTLNNYKADALSGVATIEDPDGNLLSLSEMTEFIVGDVVTLKPGYSLYIYANLFVEHINQSQAYEAGEFFVEFDVEAKWPFEQATN